MVPGSRNPMWGEEFNFSVDELTVKVTDSFLFLLIIYEIHVHNDELGRKIESSENFNE